MSDRRLLAYFAAFARPAPSPTASPNPGAQLPSPVSSSTFLRYLSTPLGSLPLPSLNLYWEVVAVRAADSVLDAMRLMSEQGVSSVAVLDEEGGSLLSAVSVTDIGNVSAVAF